MLHLFATSDSHWYGFDDYRGRFDTLDECWQNLVSAEERVAQAQVLTLDDSSSLVLYAELHDADMPISEGLSETSIYWQLSDGTRHICQTKRYQWVRYDLERMAGASGIGTGYWAEVDQ